MRIKVIFMLSFANIYHFIILEGSLFFFNRFFCSLSSIVYRGFYIGEV